MFYLVDLRRLISYNNLEQKKNNNMRHVIQYNAHLLFLSYQFLDCERNIKLKRYSYLMFITKND